MAAAPTTLQIEAALQSARDAVLEARATRARWARRHRAKSRQGRLKSALAACEVAALPLRSYIGAVAWHDLPLESDLAMKRAIAALGKERRYLRRMLAR